ncbi:chloroplast envelope quinone oxidoreductase homolog [Fagus crenata]
MALDFQYVEVPLPTPKKDEVLIKMEAASLSPIDWKIQQGVLKPMFPRELPQIPGTDVAGEVDQVGSGVKNVKAGDKVVAMLSFVINYTLTVPRPPEVSAAEGAGLPAAGLMAHQALTKSARIKLDGSGKPTNILITGASLCRTHFLIFDVNPTPSAIKTYALKKLTFNKKQLIPVLLTGKAENLDSLVKLVKEGKLKTVIDSKYSMSKPEDAWAKNADNKVNGKIIVEP